MWSVKTNDAVSSHCAGVSETIVRAPSDHHLITRTTACVPLCCWSGSVIAVCTTATPKAPAATIAAMNCENSAILNRLMVDRLVSLGASQASCKSCRSCATPCDGNPEVRRFDAIRSRIQFSRVRRGDDPVNSYSITCSTLVVDDHTIRNVAGGGRVADVVRMYWMQVPCTYIRTTAFM